MRPYHFWKQYIEDPSTGCWIWQGHIHKKTGYGYTYCIGEKLAHRVAYILTYGETDQKVLHTCHVRSCINPAHLYAGSQGENVADMVRAGRAWKGYTRTTT